MIVNKKIRKYILILMPFFFIIAVGCGPKDDKSVAATKPVIAPSPAMEPAPPSSSSEAPAASEKVISVADARGVSSSPVAVEVEGAKLTMKQLDSEMQQKLSTLKGQIPPESLDQAKTEIRRSLVDEFVVRTLLNNEFGRKKITVNDKEVTEVLNSMKTQLPAGVTMDDLLKKNKIDAAKMREDITLNIRINKLILQELGGKVAVSDKEITDFYNKNKEKFKKPESVHARHLLIAFTPGDTEKVKADKKSKAEDLRKKLLADANFADLAKKNSDCPSKESGGDLGSFSRGQMVKPFEDAAFSQEKNVIGPVVETEFGFHIIQVLEREAAQVMKLDSETKKRITAFLEREMQQGAFEGLLKKLKASANIVVYGK
jgi:peptidyl-prolyl cis-trans isomerase C